MTPPLPIELIWDRILSRETQIIRETYLGLSTKDKKAILEHLNRMATEEGWHPEQRLSAQSALDAIQEVE